MQTILCIPGPWANQTELITALVQARKGEYLFAGSILAHFPADTHFLLEFYDADPELPTAFQRAGLFSAMSEEALAAVANHRTVAYLLTRPDQPVSIAGARAVAQAAAALLDAGGVAVKVETAGKAFEAAKWHELLASKGNESLWELFVAVAIKAADGACFTCGMHNLGLKDALVRNLPTADAIQVLREFTYFAVTEHPELAVGHTFSLAAEAPIYHLAEVTPQPYADHPDFKNPFGMWELRAKQPQQGAWNKWFSKN
ncbi:hypothetical protein FNT36_15065 [Hymenobacter setariae]|uniref:DUF4261 domain-containing protein n=1 Tax=Hymenobacter setariae TaxID=2594794 RepID=A0A558BR44_9BACT|nr:hypothetical protein [Hymenobacter setariae]TVT38990.1 hypothetical protein FNT36_15065 [Hymenobacter setariae]